MIYIFWNKLVLRRFWIPEAFATKPEILKSVDGRLLLRSFSRNSSRTFRTTFWGSLIIPVGMDQTECRLPYILPCGLISRFTYSRLFYKVQTVTETTWFLRWAKKGRLHATVWCGSNLGSVLLNTGFCLCFCNGTYVLRGRAPESQPLSSVCVTHWPSWTGAGVWLIFSPS